MEAQIREPAGVEETSTRVWLAGIAGGLAGGVAMGLVMHFVMGSMPVVGFLYGQPTALAGWIAHLVHSVVFAVVFVAAITRTGLAQYGRSAVSTASLGVVYGAVLGVVTGAFALPVWINAVSGAGMAVPSFSTTGFLAHLLFGFVLGGVYAVTRGAGVTDPRAAEGRMDPPLRPRSGN